MGEKKKEKERKKRSTTSTSRGRTLKRGARAVAANYLAWWQDMGPEGSQD